MRQLINFQEGLILGASMQRINDVIYWADDELWQFDDAKRDDATWIAAKNVSYCLLEGGLGWASLYKYEPIL